MRIEGAQLAALLACGLGACIGETDDGSAVGEEIDCTGLTCDWTVLQGSPTFGPTWHIGDLGVDLSSPGPIVLELKDVLFATQDARQLDLHAVIVRDTTATMAFELDFYAEGSGTGATFWDRAPVFLVTRHVDVIEHGVVSFNRYVLVPSEGAAVVFRVIKDGTGLAMMDELTLGP